MPAPPTRALLTHALEKRTPFKAALVACLAGLAVAFFSLCHIYTIYRTLPDPIPADAPLTDFSEERYDDLTLSETIRFHLKAHILTLKFLELAYTSIRSFMTLEQGPLDPMSIILPHDATY